MVVLVARKNECTMDDVRGDVLGPPHGTKKNKKNKNKTEMNILNVTREVRTNFKIMLTMVYQQGQKYLFIVGRKIIFVRR